jgi:hypothetical protein
MKLVDYKNPVTGEKHEIDVHQIPGVLESQNIPAQVEVDGVLCNRVWGDAPIVIPIEMQSKHDRVRLDFRSTLTGKKNLFQGGGIHR